MASILKSTDLRLHVWSALTVCAHDAADFKNANAHRPTILPSVRNYIYIRGLNIYTLSMHRCPLSAANKPAACGFIESVNNDSYFGFVFHQNCFESALTAQKWSSPLVCCSVHFAKSPQQAPAKAHRKALECVNQNCLFKWSTCFRFLGLIQLVDLSFPKPQILID